MQFNQLALVPDGFAVLDTETGELFEFADAGERLRWRWNKLEAREPRMPRHAYVVLVGLTAEEMRAARAIEFMIGAHPTAYNAHWRGYRVPFRYLDHGEFRYWRSRIGQKWFVNRARPEDSEPVRRVDEGAKPIPRHEWGREPWYPPGGWWGEWKRERGQWVYYPDPRDPSDGEVSVTPSESDDRAEAKPGQLFT